MKREYHKWHSVRLNRDMELLVFGHAGARVLVIPARLGRFYDYENWRMTDTLRPTIESGNIQLFCVDSVDRESLYNESIPPPARMQRHIDYESYLLDEVLPFSASCNPNPFVIAHGCSLGAFHAVNLAFRHPHRFGKVVGLSGRYNVTEAVAHYRDLFDGYYDDTIYFHTPCHFLPQLTDEVILSELRRLEIVIAIGEEDPLRPNNEELIDTLRAKEIPVHFELWPGEAHRPRLWRQMVPNYL